MTWIRSAIFRAGLPLVVASAAPCTAAVCPVPSTSHPTIQEAVDDFACTEVAIASGTFVEEVTIGRDLDLRGASTPSSGHLGANRQTSSETNGSHAEHLRIQDPPGSSQEKTRKT